ncbi:hypothetical protein [uncultured Rikenella sp.]|uniref:hypothetical protein n=1 Tax=uncultured Rikenella sp. TaxID=368003 RepID=UPI00260964F4|nr:hypothetical protein [uncultured Rikenella sp.]
MNGTFPYYSDGVAGEKYGAGNYKATNGRLYKVSTSGAGTPLAWYPVPGSRGCGEGAFWNVGRNGYIWASTFDGTNGMHLHFHVTWLGPGNASYRAYGFPLRCLAQKKRRYGLFIQNSVP